MLAWLVGIGLLVLIVAGVVYAVALSRRARRQLLEQTQAPGLPDGAPAEWAGQHTPEAKMYRRLIRLARTLAELPLGDAQFIERKVAVETQVQELCRRLIQLARAPRDALRDAVANIEPQVAAAEAEVAALATEPPL